MTRGGSMRSGDGSEPAEPEATAPTARPTLSEPVVQPWFQVPWWIVLLIIVLIVGLPRLLFWVYDMTR